MSYVFHFSIARLYSHYPLAIFLTTLTISVAFLVICFTFTTTIDFSDPTAVRDCFVFHASNIIL